MTARRRRSRSATTLAVAVAAAFAAALASAGPGARPAAALSLLAVPDTRTIVHDHTTTVPAPGVLQNDVTVLGSVAILNSQPAHGSVVLSSNGAYTYDPDPGFTGTDVFRYHDFDGLLSTNTTTVTITVTNKAPVAASDRWSANAARLERITAPGVLKNDTDPDGDTLQAKLASGPAHGTVTLNANGGFDYTADAGFDGDDVFTYVATDGITPSAATTVTMNVSASGSTPRPSASPPPTPTPPPTPVPTPTPTPILPLPTISLPPLPLPTISLPPLPLPRPTPTPAPGTTPAPTARPTPSPLGEPAPDPSPSPDSSAGPTPSGGGSVAGGPGSAGGPGVGPGTGTGSAGGSSGTGSGGGGGTDADGPVFRIAGDGPDAVVPVVGAAFAGFDSIDWAVPALTLTVPGLLLMLAVLAQLSASAVWLPIVRRWIGAFGSGRRRRRIA